MGVRFSLSASACCIKRQELKGSRIKAQHYALVIRERHVAGLLSSLRIKRLQIITDISEEELGPLVSADPAAAGESSHWRGTPDSFNKFEVYTQFACMSKGK